MKPEAVKRIMTALGGNTEADIYMRGASEAFGVPSGVEWKVSETDGVLQLWHKKLGSFWIDCESIFIISA